MNKKKILKSIIGLIAAVMLCCGCSGGYTSDEPCVWCYQTPTKEFKTSSGTACYVCEKHAKTCSVFDKELKHLTNMLDVELFVCDDCYDEYYRS